MANKSNIYTRGGDRGTTSLANGLRVPKTHVRLEAYGTVDELNAHLGLLDALWQDETVRQPLRRIQHTLFTIGALLSDPTTPDAGYMAAATDTLAGRLKELEQAIDEIDARLPPLRAFILPGGCQAAAQCHVCRTVCRRAERRILTLADEAEVPGFLTAYINRLSDFLFVLARKANFNVTAEEITWQR